MAAVSIILPVYNPGRQRGVKALQAAMTQSMTDVEIVVVNDGSTDGSIDAMKRAAGNDPRVKFIGSGKNRGCLTARREGLDYSSGEYILMTDSDDFMHRDAVLHLLSRAHETDADLVVMNFRYYLSKLHCGIEAPAPSKRVIAPAEEDTPRELIKALYGSDGITSALFDKLVRRSCYPQLPLQTPDIFLGEDTIMSLSFAPNIQRMAVTDFCGHSYRQDGASAGFLVNRWGDFKNLHTQLCKLAQQYAVNGLDAKDLIIRRINATVTGLIRRTALLTLFSPRPQRKSASILASELTDKFWIDTASFISKEGCDKFINPRAVEAIAAGDYNIMATIVSDHLKKWRNYLIFTKLSPYV